MSKTRKQAIEELDRMRTILKNDRLTHGRYISEDYPDAAQQFGEAKGFDMTLTAAVPPPYAIGALEILFEIYDASAEDLLQVVKAARRRLR